MKPEEVLAIMSLIPVPPAHHQRRQSWNNPTKKDKTISKSKLKQIKKSRKTNRRK